MNSDKSTQVFDLHQAYCRLTGFELPCSYERQSAWFEWVRRGFTVKDLEDLIRFHKWLAKNGLPSRSLKFRNLVMSVDYAEEDLAEIRARNRVKPVNPHKAEVLQATGRTPPDGALEPMAAKPSAECVKSALEELRKAAGLQ